jgi:hypothetical protein
MCLASPTPSVVHTDTQIGRHTGGSYLRLLARLLAEGDVEHDRKRRGTNARCLVSRVGQSMVICIS